MLRVKLQKQAFHSCAGLLNQCLTSDRKWRCVACLLGDKKIPLKRQVILKNDSMSFSIFFPLSLNYIKEVACCWPVFSEVWGGGTGKVALVSSAVQNVEESQCWSSTGNQWASLWAEQAPGHIMGILSVGTQPQLAGFRVRTQTNIILFTEKKKKPNFLSLWVSISIFLEGKPWQYVENLAQIPVLCRICYGLISCNNNHGYILLFYGMYAWLPFLSRRILYCRGKVMTTQ